MRHISHLQDVHVSDITCSPHPYSATFYLRYILFAPHLNWVTSPLRRISSSSHFFWTTSFAPHPIYVTSYLRHILFAPHPICATSHLRHIPCASLCKPQPNELQKTQFFIHDGQRCLHVYVPSSRPVQDYLRYVSKQSLRVFSSVMNWIHDRERAMAPAVPSQLIVRAYRRKRDRAL